MEFHERFLITFLFDRNTCTDISGFDLFNFPLTLISFTQKSLFVTPSALICSRLRTPSNLFTLFWLFKSIKALHLPADWYDHTKHNWHNTDPDAWNLPNNFMDEVDTGGAID